MNTITGTLFFYYGVVQDHFMCHLREPGPRPNLRLQHAPSNMRMISFTLLYIFRRISYMCSSRCAYNFGVPTVVQQNQMPSQSMISHIMPSHKHSYFVEPMPNQYSLGLNRHSHHHLHIFFLLVLIRFFYYIWPFFF